MRLPNLGLRRVPLSKVADYLLDLEHAKGGAKARFFINMGFRREDLDALIAALMAQSMRCPVARAAPTPFGMKFTVEGVISMPNGRNPMIRTVWIMREDGAPELVTAYPL